MMKHGKACQIFLTILGIILICMSLLLLIVMPIFGMLGILLGVFIIITQWKHGKQQQEQNNSDTQRTPAKSIPKEVEKESSTASALENLVKKYPPAEPKTPSKTSREVGEKGKSERYHVAGTSFRQDDIKSLGYPNEDYKCNKRELIDMGMENERIYQIDFNPSHVELMEEPNDAEFPNAVKVIIDNVLVGYIKKGSANHVRNLIHDDRIKKVTAEISGGKYKYLECEYDDEKDKDVYTLTTNEKDFWITIEIFLK